MWVNADIDDCCDFLFLNPKSLRLSRRGYELLHRHFRSATVDLEGEMVRNNHLLYLGRKVPLPWYIISPLKQPKRLVLFDSQAALELKLRDGNLDKLLRSKTFMKTRK